ncbi:MAG: RNA ligase family protein [Candidatus Neomarinimicrobiota bacterium]
MKPLNRKNYGSIPHLIGSKLGQHDKYIHQGQHNIMTEKVRDRHDIVYVTEKYDGSNVGVCKKDGKIYALTRSGYIANSSKYKQHRIFSDWVLRNVLLFHALLNEGERLCGEWMIQASGMRYNILTEDAAFIVFDIIDNQNIRVSINEFYDKLYGTELKTARMLHNGGAISPSKLIEMLNIKTEFCRSCDNPEGMVYRVERKGKIDFLAKWVRSDFEPGKYLTDDENKVIWNINAPK